MPLICRGLALVLVCLCAACIDTRGAKQSLMVRGDASRVTLDPVAATSMVSAYREGSGLPAVRLDPKLNAMAQVQAEAMARRGVVSHDAAGPFRRRLDEAGIAATGAAENIAAGYFSLDAAMTSWKTSPAHNKNLLLPKATRFGIALAKAPGSGYQTYWAMVVAADPPPPDAVASLPAGPVVVQRVTMPFASLFSP